ncbi:hypothetical protein C8J56DRAFT_1048277 [Mycena floridula]|nr:hypothetical protein C8J56DRAFT_1048277 [Mycena floridula]
MPLEEYSYDHLRLRGGVPGTSSALADVPEIYQMTQTLHRTKRTGLKPILFKSKLDLALTIVLELTVVSRNCTPGLNYCGSTLNGIGNYQPQIDQCLFDNKAPSLDGGNSTLFGCIGGTNGVIQFIKDCGLGNCRDNGGGKNDTCA